MGVNVKNPGEFDRQAAQVKLELEVVEHYGALIASAQHYGLHTLARDLRRSQGFHRDMMRKAYYD